MGVDTIVIEGFAHRGTAPSRLVTGYGDYDRGSPVFPGVLYVGELV
jgi:hypothetical protein